MKYASDNRFVRGVYSLTTGTHKPFFLLAVVVLAVLAIYFPVRDLYIAHRTQDILRQQVEIRDKYNDTLQKQVDRYLSKEGVEDAARKDLGMVMPGEKTITVKGLDEDGNPVSEDSGDSEDDAASEADASSENEDGESDSDSNTLKGADAADRDRSAGDAAKAADEGKEPETSAEVEAAEKAVFENSAWYWKVLDVLFFFDGANGMAVTSTGE